MSETGLSLSDVLASQRLQTLLPVEVRVLFAKEGTLCISGCFAYLSDTAKHDSDSESDHAEGHGTGTPEAIVSLLRFERCYKGAGKAAVLSTERIRALKESCNQGGGKVRTRFTKHL